MLSLKNNRSHILNTIRSKNTFMKKKLWEQKTKKSRENYRYQCHLCVLIPFLYSSYNKWKKNSRLKGMIQIQTEQSAWNCMSQIRLDRCYTYIRVYMKCYDMNNLFDFCVCWNAYNIMFVICTISLSLDAFIFSFFFCVCLASSLVCLLHALLYL